MSSLPGPSRSNGSTTPFANSTVRRSRIEEDRTSRYLREEDEGKKGVGCFVTSNDGRVSAMCLLARRGDDAKGEGTPRGVAATSGLVKGASCRAGGRCSRRVLAPV